MEVIPKAQICFPDQMLHDVKQEKGNVPCSAHAFRQPAPQVVLVQARAQHCTADSIGLCPLSPLGATLQDVSVLSVALQTHNTGEDYNTAAFYRSRSKRGSCSLWTGYETKCRSNTWLWSRQLCNHCGLQLHEVNTLTSVPAKQAFELQTSVMTSQELMCLADAAFVFSQHTVRWESVHMTDRQN